MPDRSTAIHDSTFERKARRLLLAAGLTAGVIAATLIASPAPTEAVHAATEKAPTPFIATTPPAHVSAFARLRPRNGVLVLVGPATDFAFRVDHLDVSEGEMVVAGQPLAELDVKKERAANLAVAKAQVQEAQTQAFFAEREFARKQKLYVDGTRVISLQEYDQAHETAQLAQAKVETAKRQLAYAQVMLDQATIRAPLAGMVLRILKRPGEGVSADNGFIELGDVAHMEAVAEVFETNARFVRPHQKAVFDSPALSHPAEGTVLRILPKVSRVSLYSTDAAQNTEARVVEVVVALHKDPTIGILTGLQGKVIIDTADDTRSANLE